jgi:hypothetical protein
MRTIHEQRAREPGSRAGLFLSGKDLAAEGTDATPAARDRFVFGATGYLDRDLL